LVVNTVKIYRSQRFDFIDVFTVMEFLLFFSLAAVAIVVLILRFDKKQAIKVNTVLKKTRDMPPLYLLKSTEQKISLLKTALRYSDIHQNIEAAASMENIYKNQNENNRLIKIEEFKLLSSKYNNGQISLETYHAKLDELLAQVKKQGPSFEVAC
jgi:hypothetical protein